MLIVAIGLYQSGNTAGNTFLETLDDFFLFQHVFTPTRQHQDQVPLNLDLVLSDDENSVSKLIATDSLGKLITSWLNLNISL